MEITLKEILIYMLLQRVWYEEMCFDLCQLSHPLLCSLLSIGSSCRLICRETVVSRSILPNDLYRDSSFGPSCRLICVQTLVYRSVLQTDALSSGAPQILQLIFGPQYRIIRIGLNDQHAPHVRASADGYITILLPACRKRGAVSMFIRGGWNGTVKGRKSLGCKQAAIEEAAGSLGQGGSSWKKKKSGLDLRTTREWGYQHIIIMKRLNHLFYPLQLF